MGDENGTIFLMLASQQKFYLCIKFTMALTTVTHTGYPLLLLDVSLYLSKSFHILRCNDNTISTHACTMVPSMALTDTMNE